VIVDRLNCPNLDSGCDAFPVVGVASGGASSEGIEEALLRFGSCVEVAFGKLLSGDNMTATLAQDGLYMALSTATAYSVEPARAFCKVLATRLGLSSTLRDSIELAVHEAVVNGVMHGNLKISSDERETLARFQTYCNQVETSLSNPDLGARRIEVFCVWDTSGITVSVVDSGAGYDPEEVGANSNPNPNRKSGRGLALIGNLSKAVEIGNGGRRLTMRFDR
jgi:sigma-B regulation protein RsbU (phosphoserine phosphatase)